MKPLCKNFCRSIIPRRFSSSVNPDEVNKFSAIGNQWWNVRSSGGSSPLHTMNPTRVNYIRQQLAAKYRREDIFPTSQLKDLKILDVGCGGGLLSESLSRLGANVKGIDPSAANVAVAKLHSSKDPLTSTIAYEQTTIG